MIFVLSYLASFAALWACFYLTGRLVDSWFFDGNGLEPIPFVGRTALGCGVWVVNLFFLASTGMLSPVLIITGMVVAVLLGVLSFRKVRQQLPGFWPLDLTPASFLLALTMTVLMVGLFLQTLWPRVSWDANVYHLTVPRLYLEHHGFWRIPLNVYANWPLNTELLFSMGMAVRSFLLAKLVHFGFGCLALVLVFQVAKNATTRWAGWVAAALFLANPMVLIEIRVAYIDIALGLFLAVAFVFLQQALDSPIVHKRSLLLAGLFGGFAAGAKLTGMVGPLCLAVVLSVALLRRRESVIKVFTANILLLGPAFLLLLPWLVKSWILTGNPVYPFLYPVFGGPEWSERLQESLAAWQRSIGMGREPLDYLLLPIRAFLFGRHGYDRFDGQLSPLWLLFVPIAIWSARGRPLVARALSVSGLYFVFWALTSQQNRFLITVLPLMSIAAAVSVSDLAKDATSERLRIATMWGTTLLLVGALVFWGTNYALGGAGMMRDYLEYGSAIEGLVEEPVYKFVNDDLPADAKVLMLNTNHAFAMRRDFIADSFFEASQINELLQPTSSKEEVLEVLQGLGVTHLMIENLNRGIDYPPSLLEFLNDKSMVQLLYRSPDGDHDIAVIGDNLAPSDELPGDSIDRL